ncbi:MAG: response regulator transcription factor [Eubacteriales bacterium]|nr:response regulator transcription factor [Eubacteriales bacterium]MDD4079769.1 response regulator transcription factor [Eubacteriales bacterium]
MRVLVVDDDALIRDSLTMLLELEADFEVIGVGDNGQEAFALCQKEQPDLVLMDIRMPVMDGVLGTKLIKEHFPSIKVVILTTFKDDEYIREALKNGAEGYILKSQPADSIVDSLRAVGKGSIVLERAVASSLSAMLKEDKKKAKTDLHLTDREMEILELVGQGQTNREIAEILFLSEGTVRNYVTALLEKLNLRDRTQLAIFYLKNY